MAQFHTIRSWSTDGHAMSPIEATDRDAGVDIHLTSGSYQVNNAWWVGAAWCNMLPIRSAVMLRNASYSMFKFLSLQDNCRAYFEIFDFVDVDFTVRVEILGENRLTGKRKPIFRHVVNGPDSECFRWNTFNV